MLMELFCHSSNGVGNSVSGGPFLRQHSFDLPPGEPSDSQNRRGASYHISSLEDAFSRPRGFEKTALKGRREREKLGFERWKARPN